MNIEGKWEGWYEYGGGYILPYFAERVPFHMTIRGEDDEFEGEGTEAELPISVPAPAKIKGFVEGDYVEFLKTYPDYAYFNADGERIVEKGRIHEVPYVGYYDVKNGNMYGTWSIIVEQRTETGEWYNTELDGIWMLKRVGDLD